MEDYGRYDKSKSELTLQKGVSNCGQKVDLWWLWTSIIQAIYGIQTDGLYPQVKKGCTGTWAQINRSIFYIHAQHPNVSNILSKRISNGKNSLFWLDNWLGDTPFRDKFPRLFALEMDKSCTVFDRRSHDGWKWVWRRDIRPGVELQQLQELTAAINSVVFSDALDSWLCQGLPNGLFSVSRIRKLIDASPMGCWPTHWCKVIPPNINFFIWRARLNRLPDKCSLIDKGVNLQNVLCSSCNKHGEDLTHIFFECDVASQVWTNIASWLDLVLPVW
ncbi:uncharacterized protein [Rutidosis leptorrhynchoides]|uniref:uncharacterized protein n=1 Tax=Rutidosis leptorrhynchoides TaxID=125765 RepID=UPI003A9A33B1